MHDAYKYELFSGDGQTFIRAGQYNVPRATADGQYYYQASGQSYYTAADWLGWVNNTHIKADAGVDFWTVNNSTEALLHIAEAGFARVVNPITMFSFTAVDQSRRLVFKNGSYIVVRCTAISSTMFGYEAKYYLPNGGLVFTHTYSSSVGSTSAMEPPLPFVYRNLDGTITDYKARSFKGPGLSFSGSYLYGVRFDAAGYNYYPLEYNTSLEQWYTGIVPIDEDDPYSDIDDSTPSGPAEGTGIPESDPVDFPSLPSFSVTDTGFVTLFNPTLAQVKALADYMWNGLFDVNNFKKIVNDPMDCILGFNMVPVAVPSGAASTITIGNLITTVTMNVATAQWVEVDCGTIDIGLPYGSYLDYSPYTKFSIYLPYIGIFELASDDVAGQALHLKYHVDALSCSCVAYLKCGNHVLYQWSGSCGYSIPISQNDFSRLIMSIIEIAANGIGGAIQGGVAGGVAGAATSAVKNVTSLKPEIHRSGAIGSSAGIMGGQTPYLIIEIPKACKPAKQYHYTGYPGFITVTVGELTGYAEFEEIILDGIGCTEEERGIIESLCRGGIYV